MSEETAREKKIEEQKLEDEKLSEPKGVGVGEPEGAPDDFDPKEVENAENRANVSPK